LESKTKSALPKLPDPEQIEKKLRLSFGLFEAAFEIKKHQLSKKHPDKSERELNHLTMALFEKAAK
jgi:hypothetical protein